MVDPELERRYADCKELVDAWRAFLDLYSLAIKSPDMANAQNEQSFLNTKARIAMLHDSFMESLSRDRTTGANMLSLVNRSITLRHLTKLGAADLKKMEIEWHEIYLLLSDSVVSIEEERAKMAATSAFSHNMQKVMKSLGKGAKLFFGSIFFKVFVFLAIIGGVLSSAFIFEDDLRSASWSKKWFVKVLAFERQYLGLDAPYTDADEFINQMTGHPDIKPINREESRTVGSQEKGFLTNLIKVQLGPKGQQMAEMIGKDTVTAKAVDFKMATPVRNTFIYVFAFFSVGEAMQFDSLAQDAVTGKNWMAKRKANVVCLATSTDRTAVEDLMRTYVDTMPPGAMARP